MDGAGAKASRLLWRKLSPFTGALWASRHLYYDMKDDNLVQDMRFSGPALGVTFRF